MGLPSPSGRASAAISVKRRCICATYMLLGRCSADLLSLNILCNKDKFLKCGNLPIPPRSMGRVHASPV